MGEEDMEKARVMSVPCSTSAVVTVLTGPKWWQRTSLAVLQRLAGLLYRGSAVYLNIELGPSY